MKASIVDLRYKMKNVLRALAHNEEVHIFYHGKPAGTIVPPKAKRNKTKVRDYPFFGMYKERYKEKSVEKMMEDLRGGRCRDV